MCTNGSRVGRSTPAKARRTGNPSPSNPEGAVVTETMGRWAAVGSTVGIRGRATVLALMAGMPAPWRIEVQLPPAQGYLHTQHSDERLQLGRAIHVTLDEALRCS